MTLVLAPHLSDQAEQTPETIPASGDATTHDRGSLNNEGFDKGGQGQEGGLSAASFVHGPEGVSVARKRKQEQQPQEDGPSSLLRDRDGQEWWSAARPHLFAFVAKYLELSLVRVGPRLTNAVLVSVASGGQGGADGGPTMVTNPTKSAGAATAAASVAIDAQAR